MILNYSREDKSDIKVVVDQIVEQLKEELEYDYFGDKQWVYGVGLNIREVEEKIEKLRRSTGKMIEEEEQNTDIADVKAKVIVKMASLDLVDGAEVQFKLKLEEKVRRKDEERLQLRGVDHREQGLEELGREEIKADLNLGWIEEAPAFEAGTIEDGLKCLSVNKTCGGQEIVYLRMEDERYNSYRR